MTQFFYGSTVEDAKIIAKRGAILAPIPLYRAWLQFMKTEEPDYYEELVKGKSIDIMAQEFAQSNIATKDNIDKIILTHSVSHSLLRLAKLNEPKIVLGVEINNPPTSFLSLPGPIYLNKLTDVRLYEDAIEHKKDLMKAFANYTKNFYLVKKK